MPRFFSGDELGSIKAISYAKEEDNKTWKADTQILFQGASSSNRSRAIQKLAISSTDDSFLLSAARADGSASVHKLHSDGKFEEQANWQETRLKRDQKYVGLALAQSGVYSCTSNGALRLTKLPPNEHNPEPHLAVLPLRLAEWRLASNEQTFAYAGDEVELSVWDVGRAFSFSGLDCTGAGKDPAERASKKRKSTEQLLPGEIWRAKNLPNDSLNLRQPVRNTAFAYIQPSATPSQQHLLVGTQFGDVRRYDTRAARRPVSNWTGIGKTGGVGAIENGMTEHQVFVSDKGSSLYALDLRNGKISFGYSGFSGSVTSMAPAPSLLVSASEDRFVRLHSTFPPPAITGQQQEHKGEVLDKAYLKVVPTVVAWDGIRETEEVIGGNDAEYEDDEVWDEMEAVDSDDEPVSRKKNRTK